jgi:homoserine kinase type II
VLIPEKELLYFAFLDLRVFLPHYGPQNNLSFNVTKAKNFIDGYNEVRKLSDLEKQSIKVLSQGSALRFLLTRVFDALNTVEGAIVKVKDPMEYLKRLEFHKKSKNFEDYFF